MRHSVWIFLRSDGWESASEEEDNDSDGSWVDVHHSSDEGEGQVGGMETSSLSDFPN